MPGSLITSLKALPPNSVTLGVRASTYECGGTMQSIKEVSFANKASIWKFYNTFIDFKL
jgi:hypothetical protein